eukprot:CAMPEP_0202722726 /NCGR_PEP_ID=MMETSP1385-20130828/159856_1 /ASSEMBLY_ACC=CAM_ASM_000861 /TAXON_ID=933848 /ORGANISM="Elphidium margaritaceum" /LENGTH=32 /DNA_ID= /DNA_START= /DNA_END= /DNA_ORIENTATION=
MSDVTQSASSHPVHHAPSSNIIDLTDVPPLVT